MLQQLLATTRENERVIAQAVDEDSSTMAIVTALRADFGAVQPAEPRDSIAVPRQTTLPCGAICGSKSC